MNQTHDVNGRPWAKLSELKAGDQIELDGGFTCIARSIMVVQAAPDKALYFTCEHGMHMLAGQADDGEHCVGVYKL